MKLSTTTVTILKNLASFNPHLVIQAGNVIRTVNDKKTTLIKAIVEEEFPTEIALHDLNGFLKVISLFEDPDFEFNDDHVVISDESGATQDYQYSDKEDLIHDERNVNFPETDISVEVTDIQLKKVIKAAGVNSVEDIAIVGEDGKVFLKALDKENPKRVFSVIISEEDKGEFSVYLKHSKKGSKLNLLPLDYLLEISEHKIVKFSAKVEEVEVSYILAAEVDSEF